MGLIAPASVVQGSGKFSLLPVAGKEKHLPLAILPGEWQHETIDFLYPHLLGDGIEL